MPVSIRKRMIIFDQGGRRCGYCGDSIDAATMHTDHVTPKSRGGTHKITNLLATCRYCNTSKCNKTLDEFKIYYFVKNIMGGVSFSMPQIEAMQAMGMIKTTQEIMLMRIFYFEQIGLNVMPDPVVED